MGSNHAAELLKDMISQLYAVTRGHERGLGGRSFCFTTYEGAVDIMVVRTLIKQQKAEQNERGTDGRQEGHGQGENEEWPKGRFWGKGFEILQNIQDRTNLEAHLKRARDQVTEQTQCEQPDKSGGKRQRFDDEDRLPDITEFCISKE